MKRILLVLVGVIMSVSVCSAETAKDAARALKKLEARCQAGISYRDFAPAIGDAKFDVNMFLESEESRKSPELTTSIRKAMEHYEFANTFWATKFYGRSVNHYFYMGSVEAGTFLQRYPEPDSSVFADVPQGFWGETKKALWVDSAVNYAMNQGSLELGRAMKILSGKASDDQPEQQSKSQKYKFDSQRPSLIVKPFN